MPDLSTSLLIAAYMERREALTRFFALRLGSPAAAEDLVQDLYLKVAGLAPEDAVQVRNPPAYLYRLGSNLMLDKLKQARRSGARDEAWWDAETSAVGGEPVAQEQAADEALAARERLDSVAKALNELSPACRQAFRLHKFEGLSHAETATTMGISRSGVEKHVSAAMKHLLRRVGR